MKKNNNNKDQKAQYQLLDTEREQLKDWLKATPEQRLAWLEEAIIIAHHSGALAKYHSNRNPHI